MLLIALLVGRANGDELSVDVARTLERMLEFIAALMDCAGNVPAWGDSDDAVMIRFDPDRKASVFRSLLATGAVLFERAEFAAKAVNFDDKSRWMLGDKRSTVSRLLSPTRAMSRHGASSPVADTSSWASSSSRRRKCA